jgi:hypothetical protein
MLALAAATLSLIASMRIGRARWSMAAGARVIERACPESRNVIVTAAELIADPARARPWIRARVFEDAIRVVDREAVVRSVSLRMPGAVCLSAIVVLALALTYTPGRSAKSSTAESEQAGRGDADHPAIHATIAPPPYLPGPERSFVDPPRIEAVQGSRLRLLVRSRERVWRVRFGSQTLALERGPDGPITDMVLVESGYFAIEDGQGGQRRLLPVVVTPDRAPVIRIEAPGKDLLVPDARPSIGVSAVAHDDFGLASLELRYTKVSGSGEQFEFQEGTLALETRRPSTRDWNAAGQLLLSRLGLEPGDALVYRVVGRDARPGDAGFASSDTFFVEIAGPGQVAIAGFELPPDRERYALSQQMIVLKIQRLRARERSMQRDALIEAAGGIAAEQRAVRSNFIFLLGGHVEDEVEEAEQSHEIQEGRLENTARREINRAVQHMSRAELALASSNTSAALVEARAAVEALQRAFGRNRYILRTLPVRSRLDPARRLSGALEDASDWLRDRTDTDLDPRTRTARATLATLLSRAPAIRSRNPSSLDTLTALAEDALRVAPTEPAWQRISTALLELREAAVTPRSTADLESALAQVVSLVAAESSRGAIMPAPGTREDPVLRSAWAEAGRRR